MDRVWADWYEPVPSPPFSPVDPPGPRPATPVPGSSPPSPASTPTPPKRGRYVVEHPEYGPPPDPEEVRVHGARGPGAFCAAPWHPDTRRLGADVNRLFRGIAVSAADVTGDTRALRRALFDFYAMGYTRQRPSAPCWQALLQLSPEQSAPLRSALCELNERDVYDPRVLSPPVIEGPLFGEECDVDEDDAGSDTTVASEFSFRGSVCEDDGEDEEEDGEEEDEDEEGE